MSSMFFQMEFATLYKNLKFNLKALLQNCLGSRYRKFALFLFINPQLLSPETLMRKSHEITTDLFFLCLDRVHYVRSFSLYFSSKDRR